MTTGLTLDTGALIAFERSDRDMLKLLKFAFEQSLVIAIPAGVVAQAWRDGRKQVRLARLLNRSEVEIVALDDFAARAAGQLCGVKGTTDIVDASVVLCAKARGHRVATSDPDDLAHLDPKLVLIEV